LAAIALLLLMPAARAQTPSVQIEIGNTPDVSDDFLCWTPMPSRLRLAAVAAADVDITLVSTGAASASGAVQFQVSATPITPANFAPVDQLPLTLPKDGSWVPFHVAGKTPSVGQRDVKV